jgi:hypothetical protein
MRVIGRLLLVPIALLLAFAVAAAMLVSLGQERMVATFGRSFDVDAVLGSVEVIMRVGLAVFSAPALLPVLLLVVAGEILHIRKALYYVIGGGLASAVIPLLAGLGRAGAGPASAEIWTLFATAGFVGGLVYWLAAGRTA